MANPIEYIVFEPDQVLTNDHLNETFNYLDQQNRWTRNKLIGIGIVCGLDIVLNPGIIQINKGCGVTSQGYLITQDTNQYTYYMPYTAVDVPVDLPFVYNNGDLPFYKPFCTNKNIWLLLTDDQFNALETAQKVNAQTLSSAAANFLSDYVVALFLEIRETDLKNCDTQDCNNKGEKMVLQVRPLLVAKNDLYNNNANTISGVDRIRTVTKISSGLNIPFKPFQLSLGSPIQLKRFNVPYTDLETADDILNAFVNLVDDATLSQLTDAYNSCYQQYGPILNITSNPFSDMLAVLKNYLDLLLKQNPLSIEYFYDFIDDLIKAYNEFSAKVSHIITTGCPDENLFPLHLILGDASLATNDYVKDSYRNYFIYSPLFSKMGIESAEVLLLFSRMVLLIKDFTIPDTTQSDKFTIKITPSQYTHFPLSERAIPYYYTVNESGAELYKSWNYAKTNSGNATLNLGYNSGLYNNSTAVTQPLLYDIEKYNFFRVEGHIGQNYQDVLSNILIQRLTYNLPFDVIAIADEQFDFSNMTLPDAETQDLELDYKLILAEAQNKILDPFAFVAGLPYVLKIVTGTNIPGRFSVETDNPIKRFSEFKTTVIRGTEPVSSSNTNYNNYSKGDFMRIYCPPQPNTIGSAYLDALSSTGVFTNPIISHQPGSIDELYFYFFNFIDAIEELMVYLRNTDSILNIDVRGQNVIFNNYYDSINNVIATLKGPVAKTQVPRDASMISLIENYELDVLIVAFETLINIDLDDRLWELTHEADNRYSRYADKHKFSNYYKNNPGLEHKAGVPKGGTLVLVYKNYIPNFNAIGLKSTNTSIFKASDTASRVAGMAAAPTEGQKAVLSSNLDENTLNMVRKMVTESKGVSDTEKMRLIDILAGRDTPVPEPNYNINNKIIIADFYVPYIGSPIERSSAEMTPPPPPAPVITMGNTFCDNDTNPAPITVSIPGGTFNTVPGLDPVKQTFIPALAKAGTYRIIYTVNNISSDPFVVTVLPVPDSRFTFINDWSGNRVKGAEVTTKAAVTKGIVSATFTPNVRDNRFTYDWKVSANAVKGAVATDGVVRISYDTSVVNVRASTVEVSLTISNGNCNSYTSSMELDVSSIGFSPVPSDGPPASLKKPGAIEKLFTRKKKS
ncbi:hypothetical protein SAMN05421821_10494 [Mucilaginibacter lappiensis]|uniref:Uncharacterized protein n=1 Tax=Mucilaginibacter lappiensis TaxID=354630 RepID=A0ABR6PI93_9SPHI|nr:hypothetical protein [Mucilaginibacter lappiensis]MBB6109494.1 hypothetical protein [Mucilaginibacter lappiensis]SIQ93147.1 hypothetical protein SAMN05421821_10494 [Mucilaginibacter lappiensis]